MFPVTCYNYECQRVNNATEIQQLTNMLRVRATCKCGQTTIAAYRWEYNDGLQCLPNGIEWDQHTTYKIT